jgi:hypothetical protein
LDPDPYWIRIGIQPKVLDPDPVEVNANPQPWEQGHSKYLSLAQLLTGTEARDLYSKGAEILTSSLQAQPFLNSTNLK